MKKLHTKERGITIITLVITIIILLILAGISIASLVGNDGLINKAKKATKDYENKQEEELALLDEFGNYIDSGKLNNENNTNNKDTSNEAVLEKIGNLEEQIKDLQSNTFSLDKVYPVGAIYISIDATEPSTLFGGTWESYGQGRTLVGVGTGNDGTTTKTFSVNSTGGEYNHTLSVAEMPKHSHNVGISLDTGIVPGHMTWSQQGYIERTWWPMTVGSHVNWESTTNGNNQSHNIVQPYITVYMWKRVN